MKKDDDELEGMDAQEPIEGDAQDNANGAGAGAPDGDDGGEPQAHSSYQVPKDKKLQLSGMYENWFLDYASYVILERAVPHIEDGFKPVQRRIMHAMKEADDGHFNKVANVRWSSWDKRSCSSTPRVTGVTSSPATVRLQAVTSRPA